MNQMIVQCSICGDRRNPETHVWSTPTREERIKHHKHISHGYCDSCFIVLMRDEGMSEHEIKDLLLTQYNHLQRG